MYKCTCIHHYFIYLLVIKCCIVFEIWALFKCYEYGFDCWRRTDGQPATKARPWRTGSHSIKCWKKERTLNSSRRESHVGTLAYQPRYMNVVAFSCGQVMWTHLLTLEIRINHASIIHLYKHEGRKCECDTHTYIIHLCVAEKNLGRVILNKLNYVLVRLSVA